MQVIGGQLQYLMHAKGSSAAGTGGLVGPSKTEESTRQTGSTQQSREREGSPRDDKFGSLVD